jgi:hypothetical protein
MNGRVIVMISKGCPGVQGVKAIYTAIRAFRNGGLLSITAIYDAW